MKMETTNKTVKIFSCENAGENKTLEENCSKNTKEIKLEFASPGAQQKMAWYNRDFLHYTPGCA